MKLRPIRPLESRPATPLALPSWIPRERLLELFEQYKPAVAAAGVAVVVLVLFAILYVRHSRQVTERSSELFRNALSFYTYKMPPPGSDVMPAVGSDEEKYQRAQAIFQQIHDTYPGSRLAPGALYYVGNCRYQLKQYTQALESYDLFLSRFRRHPLAAQARLAKGDCLEQLSRFPEAYDAYRAVFDAGGPLAYEGALGASRCLLKLTETDRNRWSEAVDLLNKLASGSSPRGARESRALRKLLADLSEAAPRPADAPARSAPAGQGAHAPQPAPQGGGMAPAGAPGTAQPASAPHPAH